MIVDGESWVNIRRQWNDYRCARVKLRNLSDLRWDQLSGGVKVLSPQPFIHGYASCSDIEGDIAHSCLHGEGPHRIRVCIVKKDNEKSIYKQLLDVVGPKPKYAAK